MLTPTPLIALAFLAFFFGLVFQATLPKFAGKLGLLAYPTTRRRHSRPTPTTGGIGIFLTWLLGLAVYAWLDPAWALGHAQSLTVLVGATAMMVALGWVDDCFALRAGTKLLVQSAAAIAVIIYEPQVHQICLDWEQSVGPVVWLCVFLWIVGITNAINLIDGIDGLAGGTAALVSVSILTLGYWTHGSKAFIAVCMVCLIPGILSFLKFNWNPARCFLGDSGSLPLGFLIASGSLMCRPQSKSWILLASVVLMLGFPILDMGLAVMRRYQKKVPLFRADRVHLHYRLQRLGLNVRQTSLILLSITAYLQVTALCVNHLEPILAALALAFVTFSLFTVMFMVKCIEVSRVNRLSRLANEQRARAHQSSDAFKQIFFLNIDLSPLTESGLLEERERYHRLVDGLMGTLQLIVRAEDRVMMAGHRVSILLSDFSGAPADEERLRERFERKIIQFLELVDVQGSLSTLPISFENRTVMVKSATALQGPLDAFLAEQSATLTTSGVTVESFK